MIILPQPTGSLILATGWLATIVLGEPTRIKLGQGQQQPQQLVELLATVAVGWFSIITVATPVIMAPEGHGLQRLHLQKQATLSPTLAIGFIDFNW